MAAGPGKRFTTKAEINRRAAETAADASDGKCFTHQRHDMCHCALSAHCRSSTFASRNTREARQATPRLQTEQRMGRLLYLTLLLSFRVTRLLKPCEAVAPGCVSRKVGGKSNRESYQQLQEGMTRPLLYRHTGLARLSRERDGIVSPRHVHAGLVSEKTSRRKLYIVPKRKSMYGCNLHELPDAAVASGWRQIISWSRE